MRAASMDLWAVGAVLHELVDGARFRGGLDDVRALYRVAMAGEVPPATIGTLAASKQRRVGSSCAARSDDQTSREEGES